MNLLGTTLLVATLLVGALGAASSQDNNAECGGSLVYNCQHTHTDEDGNETKIRCLYYIEGDGSGIHDVSVKGPNGIEIQDECAHVKLPAAGS